MDSSQGTNLGDLPANAGPAGGSQSVRPLFNGIATCSHSHAQLFRANGPPVPMPGDTFSPPLLLTGPNVGPNGRRKSPGSSTALASTLELRREASAGLRPRLATQCQPVDIRATENSMGLPSLLRRIGVIVEGELDVE